MAQTGTADGFRGARARSWKDWAGWYYVPGLAFVVIGILAIAEPPLASLAAAFYVGAMLLVGGAFMFLGGILNLSHRGGWIAAVLGLLSFVTGLVVIENPVASAVSLVWLLGGWLILGGILELGIGIRLPVGRGWLILVSLLNILLGAFVLTMNPGAAFPLLGYFVGVSLMFQGLWSLIFTSQLHQTGRAGEPTRV